MGINIQAESEPEWMGKGIVAQRLQQQQQKQQQSSTFSLSQFIDLQTTAIHAHIFVSDEIHKEDENIVLRIVYMIVCCWCLCVSCHGVSCRVGSCCVDDAA